MARLRISHLARSDLEHALAVSLDRWREDGQARCRALLEAAFHAIATAPDGPTTRDRSSLWPGLRSFHIHHVRRDRGGHDPVHVIYYRATRASIEVVRVLHERMDPTLHLEANLLRRRADRR